MSKILLYSAILLTLLTAGVGYWNQSCYQIILLEKKETLQQQEQEIAKLNEELHSLKEKFTSQTTTEEQSQKALTEAQEARTQAETSLADLQKQLAAQSAELEQKSKELLAKEATINSLSASSKNTTVPSETGMTVKKKSSKNKVASEKKDPGVAPVDATSVESLCAPSGAITGKVAAMNASWNFVVLNIGENNGLTKDSEMTVTRKGQVIGKIKVTSVEPLTSIGDIIPNSLAQGVSIQVGDDVFSMPNEIMKK